MAVILCYCMPLCVALCELHNTSAQSENLGFPLAASAAKKSGKKAVVQSVACTASPQGGCASSELDHGLTLYRIQAGYANNRPIQAWSRIFRLCSSHGPQFGYVFIGVAAVVSQQYAFLVPFSTALGSQLERASPSGCSSHMVAWPGCFLGRSLREKSVHFSVLFLETSCKSGLRIELKINSRL